MWGKVGNVEIAKAIVICPKPEPLKKLKCIVEKECVTDEDGEHHGCPLFGTGYWCNANQRNCDKNHEQNTCPLLAYDKVEFIIKKES